MKTTLTLTFLLFSLFMTSCIGVGNQGPQGPAGPPGTANVTTSEWLTYNPSYVYDTVIDNTYCTVVEIPAPGLNWDIIDYGIVNVYMRFNDEGVYPLPYTSAYEVRAGVFAPSTMSFILDYETILITRYAADYTNLSFGNCEFRYIYIPASYIEEGSFRSNNFNINDYESVCSYFGIEK